MHAIPDQLFYAHQMFTIVVCGAAILFILACRQKDCPVRYPYYNKYPNYKQMAEDFSFHCHFI